MDRQQFLDQRQKESCDAVARETAEMDREFKSLEAENGVDSIFNLFDRRLSSDDDDEGDEPKPELPLALYRLLFRSILATVTIETLPIVSSLRAKPPKSPWSLRPPSSRRISTLPRILEGPTTTPRLRSRSGIARRVRATLSIRSEW